MTPNEYQIEAHKTAKEFDDPYLTIAHASLTAAAEAGELANLTAKFLRGKNISPEEILSEAGDVLWGVAEVLTNSSLTMQDAMEANIDKLRARHGVAFKEAHYK